MKVDLVVYFAEYGPHLCWQWHQSTIAPGAIIHAFTDNQMLIIKVAIEG